MLFIFLIFAVVVVDIVVDTVLEIVFAVVSIGFDFAAIPFDAVAFFVVVAVAVGLVGFFVAAAVVVVAEDSQLAV